MSTTDTKTLVIPDFRTLPAYHNAREKQEALVANNPFVEITDAKSFDSAKKARTALRQGRYELQNGKKVISSVINDFKKDVDTETTTLISITRSHEDKQQAEVERWEEDVRAKKEEAKRIEQARIDKIKNFIIEFRLKHTDALKKATLESIDSIVSTITNTEHNCQEFEQDFDMVKDQLIETANEKQKQLQDAERVRLENERLRKEREELEAERKKMEAKRKADELKLKAERDELLAEKKKIEEQKAKEEAEAKAIKQEELRKKAAIEIKRRVVEMQHLGYELKDNEFAFGNIIIKMDEVTKSTQFDDHDLPKFERIIEGEIKRIEALKPDKEKLSAEVDSLATLPKDLRLQTDAAQQLYAAFLCELSLLKENYKNEVSNL